MDLGWKNLAVRRIGNKLHLKKIENISSVFINGLAFLVDIGKASLPKFTNIYGSSINDVLAAGERVDDFKKKLSPD
jgi:hypothetical protein